MTEARLVARLLRIGLIVSLGCLGLGLALTLLMPGVAWAELCFKFGLFALVLTPPLKSLALGVHYLKEQKVALGLAAVGAFLIVLGVWYWQ